MYKTVITSYVVKEWEVDSLISSEKGRTLLG